MSQPAKRIFGVGTVVVDHVVLLPKPPIPDTKSTIQADWRQIGGPVPVALSTAAHYGCKTTFFGRWGNDAAGNYIVAGLTNRGIEIAVPQGRADHADLPPGWKTGFAHVWTEAQSGTRTIAYSRGEFPLPTGIDLEQQADQLKQAQILHLDGWAPEAALAAAHQMQRQGGVIVLDAGSKKPGMENLLPMVDVLIASDLFCSDWFSDDNVDASTLLQLGCKAVIRTRGAAGADYTDRSQSLHVPGLDITALDTNGAGDIFSGAFLYGLARRWPPQRGLEFANVVAGLACAERGNSTWASRSEVARHVSRAWREDTSASFFAT